MHGTYAANMALSEADLIINIGSRFDDRLATAGSQFGQQAIIAHIDIDPAEIGKVVQTTIPIVADANSFDPVAALSCGGIRLQGMAQSLSKRKKNILIGMTARKQRKSSRKID